MGRGRAKAKQTKVARKLKYSGGHTDLERLRRELGVGGSTPGDPLAADPLNVDHDRVDDEAEYVPADWGGGEGEPRA